jgi:hypothetical protein
VRHRRRRASPPPSARVRAIEVLLRISKQQQPEDAEWERIVRQFGPDRAGDAAERRLVHYCRRVPLTPSEFGGQNCRHVRYVGQLLRRLVWSDVEVRDALLAAKERAGSRALIEVLTVRDARCEGLHLLDLATAMSLEASSRGRLYLGATLAVGDRVAKSPRLG